MKPIPHVPVLVANGGTSSVATHIGTIRIGLLETEAYYVPSFKQTLISKGYLFRKGYLPVYDTDGKVYYKNMKTQQVVAVFKIANDDLYYLHEETQSVPNKIYSYSS